MSRKSTDKGKHWTDRDKLKAIAAFALYGNASKVEEVTGIPAGTVNYWKTLPWWFEEMEKLRKAEDEQLVSRYTKIVLTTMDKLENRLESGDEVILKDGSRTRKEVNARDLAAIANVLADKRHKTLETRTEERVKAVTVGERLKQLEEQFTKFVTSKVVEGEIVHKVVEITAPITVEEIQNEGKEGIEEAREEGIESVREEGNEKGGEEGEEVLNAENLEEISETTSREGCEECICSSSESVAEARNTGEGEYGEVDGEGQEAQLNVSWGAS